MIRSIVITANDALYEYLVRQVHGDDDIVRRATNVLDGYRLVMSQPVDKIVIDLALHAADTLVETLHSRPETTRIPVCVVKSGKQIPFELRRLCTDILEAPTR